MFGSDRHAATAGLARRVATLREELDRVQDALWHKERGWERVASDAKDWLSDHAGALPLPHFRARRTHLSLPAHAVPVALAALAVGVGVGCVLYALTSPGMRGSRATTSAQGGAHRPSSKVVE